MTRPQFSRASRGFTLLEALVALVIFSMAAMGIYAWVNTSLKSLNRIAEVAATEQVLNSSIERLKLVDLSAENGGSFNVNGYWVEWNAQLVEPWKHGVTQTGAQGIYDLGLFNISLTLSKSNRVVGGYSYRSLAYQQVRDLTLEGETK